ncbi:MAG: OmpA family protein [Planctomycetota bacterium]|nr:OmpA family protein [Planctomycetota bacterium]
MDDEAPPGVPEWVVTYGDMMSLLLTFFIMLVSLSEVVADQKFRAMMQSFHEYFGYRTGPQAPPGKNFPLNSLVPKLDQLGSFTDEDIGEGGVKIESVEGKDVLVYRTREGTPLQIGPAIRFESGVATIARDQLPQLKIVAEELAGKPNKIDIHCHASPEDLPDTAAFKNKIRLTNERGRAVMRVLEDMGIAPDRLRLSALGDTQPLQSSGDRRSLHHDRVELIVLDAYADEFRGPADGPQ